MVWNLSPVYDVVARMRMRAGAIGMTSNGRSTLTACQNVDTEFITHVSTVLDHNYFSRAVTPYVLQITALCARGHASRQLHTFQADRNICVS